MVDSVNLEYPGLIRDRTPAGNVRWLVRVQGQRTKRITLSVGPGHPQFHEAYLSARAGVSLTASKPQHEPVAAGTVAWLCAAYLTHLERSIEAGQASPLTLKQRKSFADQLLAHKSTSERSFGKQYRTLPMSIPQEELMRYLDTLMATPGKAKNMLKFLRAMYKWAVTRKYCLTNPAAGLNVEYKSKGGATPWTIEDLQKYREIHPHGTQAHLTLSLFMFTACRISDAFILGRGNEFKVADGLWLGWEPSKARSKRVEVPILPPLLSAIRAQTVVGPTYLMTSHGQPFKSPEGLRNRFKKWCRSADLPDRSSHGIRKAAGHLLSLYGATQYEIMAIHGHSQASTSEVYTKDVERQRLARSGMSKLAGMDW